MKTRSRSGSFVFSKPTPNLPCLDRMRETRGYLEFVVTVDIAEKQVSEPSEGCIPKVIVRLAEKALCVAKRWNKLQRKVKYWHAKPSIWSQV